MQETVPDRQRATPSSSGAGPAASPFVGRRRELETLRAALERAVTATGGLAMLAGDAGMGKTRLCQEVAAEAARRDVPVIWGRCLEEPGAPAYWPWSQAIRALLEDCDDARLRDLLGDGAPYVAGIVPEVGRRLSDLPPIDPVDGDQARFQLFHAVATTLGRAARERGLLLILDNLHWADPSSLRLLAFLAAELGGERLLLVGTYRETELSRRHPLSDTLAELTSHPALHRLRLAGLSGEETEQFLRTACGAIPTAATVATLHARTEGHPLFLVETVRYLLEGGEQAASRLTAIPASVREIIGKRLNRLAAPCVRLLSIAACIGREFSLELLLPLVAESAEDAVLAALEEAIAARVIDPLPRPGHFQFSHALIRETLYDEMLHARRVRLHLRIGELLEARHRDDPAACLPQLAYHFSAALPEGPPARALDYVRRAAERAEALLAHEEAVRFYELALRLQQEHFPEDRACRCRLLLALGTAQNWAGDIEDSLDTFRVAGMLARELGAADALAEAALGFESGGWRIGHPGAEAAALLQEALAGTSIHEAVQVDLHAALCRACIYCNDPAAAHAAWQRAVELARRHGDAHGLFKALSAIVPARFWPEQLERRLAAAREALALAERAGHPEWAVGQLTGWYFGDLVEKGEIPAARRLAVYHLRVAEAMHWPFLQAVGLAARALLALYEGQYAEAEGLARETYAMGRRVAPSNAAGLYGMQMFSLRREQGRLQEVLPVLRHFVQTTPAEARWRPGLALVYAELGMAEEARAEYERLAADDFAAVPFDGLWLTSVTYLAEVGVFLQDEARAGRLYRMLEPYAGRNVVTGPSTVCHGSADRFLGMLAELVGKRDLAGRHFEAALAVDGRHGGRPCLAHSRYRYASLLSSGREADPGRARPLLEGALATAEELGMAMLAGRCRRLAESLEERRAFPDGLSRREVEVLQLLVRGHTNQEIGGRLFISANTVANHIRSILAKTGTANRTEAAAYAIRKGLSRV